MQVQITCRCEKTSEWNFSSCNVFKCRCGKKINVAGLFIKEGFRFAILDNHANDRKYIRLVWEPLFVYYAGIAFLSAVVVFILVCEVLVGIMASAGIKGILFSVIAIALLTSCSIGLFSTLRRRRLVLEGYSVVGLAKKKGLEPEVTDAFVVPMGKKYSIRY